VQVLVGFGTVGAFAAVLLPPVENARQDSIQGTAGSPRYAPTPTAALDDDRSTAALAPAHIRAQLETIEESASVDIQPGEAAGTCVICPSGSTLEAEPNCGLPVDTTNGGCNTPPTLPPQFSRIICGQTYCGTAGSDGGIRDTDWYEVVVPTQTRFTWTVFPGFPAAIGLVEMNHPGSGDCADSTLNLNPIAQVAPCTVGSVTVCLPPGKHWFFVAPQFGIQVNCGANYTARLTCESCGEGACCADGCFITDRETCNSVGGPYLGDGTDCRDKTICQPAEPCAECGPGQHWIHLPDCPPGGVGADIVPSGAVLGIDRDLDCVADVNIVAFGPATIGKRGPVDDATNFPGTRPIDQHKDVVDTEILAMSLTGGGFTLTAGAGLGNQPLSPSHGAVAEQPGDPALADSFFDVFVEVDLGGGNYLYNQTPVRVRDVITCMPPDANYFHITACLPLYTSPTPGQGIHVANLTSANHFTYPACCFGSTCRKDVPTQICEQENGTVVPDCLGNGNNNDVDDACEEGACCLPPSCESGGVCNAYEVCEGGYPCLCFKTTAGNGNCAADYACSNPQCPSGTSDCPPGMVCYVDTCCGQPTCGPSACLNQAISAAVDATRGPTASGGQGAAVNGGIAGLTPTCIETNRQRCDALGGLYRGDKTVCTPESCLPPVVEVDFFPNTRAFMEFQFPGGSVPIALSGPTTVHVFFEGPNEGDANDSNGNGRDDVGTEIVDMQLTGNSPLGPVLVKLHPTKPSRGQIEETVNIQVGRLDVPPFGPPGSTADSFFDVFFEIHVIGQVFHTQTPKRMSSVIAHKPPAPGDTYENPDKIPLLDEQGNTTPYSIGPGRHIPRPEMACCLPNGQCRDALPIDCEKAGGTPHPGTLCLGDQNGDGIDDACGARPCEECGPGSHWLHNPPCPPGGTGSDTLPSGAYAGIDFTGDCVADSNLVLFGPATIRKRGPADDSEYFPGLRPVDGHLDVVNTELVAMSLTGGGVVLTAGGGWGAIPLRPSYGAVAEQPGDPSLADSFFDVFFEVETPAGRLYNLIPIRVETTVTCLPPDGIYAHIVGCTPLSTSPHPGQGQIIAYLTSANHFTYPGCCFGTSCVDPAPSYCEEKGGTLVPDCLGDNNNNQIDDACEGACCVPQTCTPGTCEGGFSNCEGNPNCFCFTAAEGGGSCSQSHACAALVPCPNGTSDCPLGQVCHVDTCCGGPVCEPEDCVTATAGQPRGDEPSSAGGQGAVSGEIIVPPPVCIVTDRLSCEERGGIYEGNGTFCTPETCQPPEEACCLPQGQCELLTPERCRIAHGVPLGPDSQCKGDNNGNTIDDACEPAKEPCEDCGPGAHWMHDPPCPPGADLISTGAVVGISINLDCVEDTNLVLSGTAAVLRSGPRDDSANYPGLRPIDGHRDVIDTEMVSMSLTGSGFTLVAGAGLGQGGVLPPSQGAIAEKAGDPALADSFFDVFFEIRADGGGAPVYNQDPVRVRSEINCLPPNATYFHLIECLPLYTSPIPGQGSLVAYLTSANHSTFPECGDPGTGSCYVPHDPPFCDNGECCKRVCAQIPECCDLGWKPDCAERAREICVQPTVLEWESVLTHSRPGVDIGPVGLEIPDDGTFSEPRNLIRKIVVTFDLPIDPASVTKENVNICGLKPGDEPDTFVPVYLGGIAITVKTSDGDTKLEINFEPGLPDFARYHISIKGIYGYFGPLKPGDGGLSRILTALRGDARMDLRVNSTDVGAARFLVGATDPIDPTIPIEVRCDVSLDARVNSTDVGGIRSLIPSDARNIPNPVCP